MIKKILFLTLIIITALTAVCYAAPPSDDYKLVLADEFDGTELNRDIWDYRSGNPYGGKNLKENVRIEDGMLHLDYRKVDGSYTGGGVLTPFTLPYGYYEVEALVYSGAKGLHTSFWTSGGSSFTTTPKFFPIDNCFIEIDVFEIDSREDDEHPNVHHGVHNWCGVHTSPYSARYNTIDTTKEWFTMGMEWLPDKISYYINGECIDFFDKLNIYSPSYMWLTAVAMPEKFANGDGTFNIDDSKMDENGYFGSSLFKYFRYYQKPLKGVNLLGNPNFEYNRVNNSVYPSTFVLLGDKKASYIQKSPFAYDGFCYHTHQSNVPYSLSTGQEFAVLYPGKYTFRGQFMATSGLTKSRIVIYDKEENVIAEKEIPECDDWTEVSLTDVYIDGYAYVAVESASNGNTMLSIDALEFFTQEGELYTGFNTPSYEDKTGTESFASSIYTLDNAASSTGTWGESSLEKGTYWLTGTERDVEVSWDIPIGSKDLYRIELRNIIHSNNVASQDYYITTPDGVEQKITIDTKNGETSWITLGKYNLDAGDTLKITMKSNAKSGNVRINKLRLTSESDILAYETATMQLNQCVFTYLNTPYIFDKSNKSLTPYEENGIYYIPYQKLKETTGYSAEIDENSEYVTTAQLEDAGYTVTFHESYILLNEGQTEHTENSKLDTTKQLSTFTAPYFPELANFVSDEDISGQIVKTVDDAILTGTEWQTSSHILPHKYSGSASSVATWTFDVSDQGLYAVDIYSPSHSNSATNAEVTLYTYGKSDTFSLNQTMDAGWYRLTYTNVRANSTIKILMKNKANGLMRVAKARLVPLSVEPTILKSGKRIIVRLGENYTKVGSIILRETNNGVVTYSMTVPASSNTNFFMNNADSDYKLFFWLDLDTLLPLCEPIVSNQKGADMIRKILLLTMIIITALTAICYAAPPSDDYQLVLADEFEGSVLNTDMWTYRTGNPYGGKNLKENVRTEDGMLKLDYRKLDGSYTGGGVITPFTLPYGYYEVKAKVYTGANGFHTSFWTSGATDSFEVTPENTPYNNWFLEIDAFEINSREDEEVPNVDHGINNWCGGHTVPFSSNYYETDTTKDWFVMGMEWLPDSVKYYMNGKLINEFDGLNIFGPSYLWLTAVASPEKYNNGDGTYNIDDSKMDETGYFGSSLFEYFRYYQKPLKGVNLMGNPNFEYNRAVDSAYPSTFVLKGDKAASYIQKTPLAYDGLYYHTHQSLTPYFLSTGQEFAALCPGKYTFRGQFKATDGFKTARIVVYDKEGNVLSEKPIPKATEWTEVSLTDIQIESYAYAAIESASDGGTMLSVDALEFYTQEGEAYERTNTPYYEYIETPDPLASYTYGLNDAKNVTGEWTESGSDKGTYWLTGDLRDVEVTWEIPVENDDIYRLDVKNLIYANNVKSQDYYITLPDGTEEKFTLDTKNGVTRWETLGKYNIKADETLKITMKSSSKSGNVRITKLRFISESDISAYESTTIRLNKPVFCHFGNPFIFDNTNKSLTPYEQDGIYYIPYKALKEVTGYTADIDENSLYVTTKQLEAAGVSVTLYEDYILLHDKNTVHNQNSIIKAAGYLSKFSEPYFPRNSTFIANADEPCQIVQTSDSATLVGLSWKSSQHILQHKYTNQKNASATWTFDVLKDGTYTVDIFSPSSSNSTSNAEITVYSPGENSTFSLNQTGEVGWYRLKTVDVKAGDKISIYMEYKSGGYMRAAKVRIVPASVTPKIETTGENLLVQLGENYSIVGAVILAEYINGVPTYTLESPTGTSLHFTLNNKENPYKLFFWKSLESGMPLCAPIINN